MGNENNMISPKLSDKMRNMSLLCAFFVVVIHCRPHFESGTIAWLVWQFSEEGITRVAVPYFFAASGFVAAAKFDGGGYRTFVLKRLRSLLLPFAIWTFLFWLFVFAINCWNAGSPDAKMLSVMRRPLLFLKRLGFWPIGYPFLTLLWYVRALLCLTIVFPILWRCVRQFGVAWLVAMFLLYGLRIANLPFPFWDFVKAFAGFGLLPVEGLFYYSLGIWLCDRPERLDRQGGFWHVAGLIVGLVVVGIHTALILQRPFSSLAEEALSIASCKFVSVPFMLYGIWGLVPDWRLPGWLVSCSFAIYLIHKFVLQLLNRIWSAGDGLPQYFAMAAAAFSIALGIAVAMHRWLPRTAAVLFGGR